MLLNNFWNVSSSTLLLIAVFLEGSSSTTHDSVDPTSFSVILFRLVLSPLCLDFLFRFWFQSFHPKLKMAIFDTVLIKNSNPIFFLFFFLKTAKKCLHGHDNIFQSGQKQQGILSSPPKSRFYIRFPPFL